MSLPLQPLQASAFASQVAGQTSLEAENYLDRYDQEIENNQELSQNRQEELKQRIRNLVEPMGQEVFRISAERLLKKYGLKKYYDAIKSGDTDKLVNTLSDDIKSKGKEFIQGKADEYMKARGYSDEDIQKVKDAVESGDFSKIAPSDLKNIFDGGENLQQVNDVAQAARNSGASSEDIRDLPTSMIDDLQNIPRLINSGLQNSTERLSNLAQMPDSLATTSFRQATNDQPINTDNFIEHMSALNAPQGNILANLRGQVAQPAQQAVEQSFTMPQVPEAAREFLPIEAPRPTFNPDEIFPL